MFSLFMGAFSAIGKSVSDLNWPNLIFFMLIIVMIYMAVTAE